MESWYGHPKWRPATDLPLFRAVDFFSSAGDFFQGKSPPQDFCFELRSQGGLFCSRSLGLDRRYFPVPGFQDDKRKVDEGVLEEFQDTVPQPLRRMLFVQAIELGHEINEELLEREFFPGLQCGLVCDLPALVGFGPGMEQDRETWESKCARSRREEAILSFERTGPHLWAVLPRGYHLP